MEISPRAPFFSRKLKALEYPDTDSFTVEDDVLYQTLVAWLEDVKIRFYKINDREPLRKYTPQWGATFCKYLTDLKCPRKYSEKMNNAEKSLVLDWLLSYSINLTYKDNAEQLNRNAEVLLSQKSIPHKVEDTTNYDSPEFRAAVESLANTLSIPSHKDTRLMLKAILELVERKFSESALKEAAKQKEGEGHASFNKEKFPLGFDTGDERLNEAATILRMLYIDDLRSLQTKINELLVSVQSYTANPKTDTSLGKVGK